MAGSASGWSGSIPDSDGAAGSSLMRPIACSKFASTSKVASLSFAESVSSRIAATAALASASAAELASASTGVPGRGSRSTSVRATPSTSVGNSSKSLTRKPSATSARPRRQRLRHAAPPTSLTYASAAIAVSGGGVASVSTPQAPRAARRMSAASAAVACTCMPLGGLRVARFITYTFATSKVPRITILSTARTS